VAAQESHVRAWYAHLKSAVLPKYWLHALKSAFSAARNRLSVKRVAVSAMAARCAELSDGAGCWQATDAARAAQVRIRVRIVAFVWSTRRLSLFDISPARSAEPANILSGLNGQRTAYCA
jgi:hypothetical protein